MVNRKKNGQLYTEDATISPIRGPDGVVTSYVAVQRDITATLALEAQFLQAQKMEAVGRLAGGVAHDFNNILSVVLSYAQMICEDLEPEAPLRDDVEEIRRAAMRAVALTRHLLAFSRKEVFEPRLLDVNDVIAEAEKLLRRLLGADIELTLRTTSDVARIMADPGQIEQILMNLAVNARDAMPHGGTLTIGTANVELDDVGAGSPLGARPGAYVELTVRDTGIGMTPDTQARIFEPFFTTKESGTGYGLYLASEILREQGGLLTVANGPEHGACFTVWLPTAAEPAPAGIG